MMLLEQRVSVPNRAFRPSSHPRSSRCTLKTPYPRRFRIRSGHRFYSSTLGKWISRDPLWEIFSDMPPPAIGGQQGSPYRYVDNNPLGLIDLLGLCTPGHQCNEPQCTMKVEIQPRGAVVLTSMNLLSVTAKVTKSAGECQGHELYFWACTWEGVTKQRWFKQQDPGFAATYFSVYTGSILGNRAMGKFAHSDGNVAFSAKIVYPSCVGCRCVQKTAFSKIVHFNWTGVDPNPVIYVENAELDH